MRTGIFKKFQDMRYHKSPVEMDMSEKWKYLFYIKNNGRLKFGESMYRKQNQLYTKYKEQI